MRFEVMMREGFRAGALPMGNGHGDKSIMVFIEEFDQRLTLSRLAVTHLRQELLTYLRNADFLHPKGKVVQPLESRGPHPSVETPLHEGADRIIDLIRMARHAADCPISPNKRFKVLH
jgi:hypothetical protein